MQTDKYLFFRALRSIIILISLTGCDKGLAPDIPSSPQYRPFGISGVVYFKNWPPLDSIRDLRVAAMKTKLESDFVNEVIQGKVRFTETLQPFHVDSIPYTLLLNSLPPGIFSYIGVAYQFGQNRFTDWRIVGLYYENGDTTVPGSIFVPADSIIQGVNIFVNFLNPPPQP